MRCRAGHLSEDRDYCSVCGIVMSAPPQPAGPAVAAAPATPVALPALPIPCPACGETRADLSARFCEVCRFDFGEIAAVFAPPALTTASVAGHLAAPATAATALPHRGGVSAATGAATGPTTEAGSAKESAATDEAGTRHETGVGGASQLESAPRAKAATGDDGGGAPQPGTGTVMPPQKAGEAPSLPEAGAAGQQEELATATLATAYGTEWRPEGAGTAPLPPGAETASPASGGAAAITRWRCVVQVDPALDTDPDPDVPCPSDEPERVFDLDQAELLIGRRDDRRDIRPDIPVRDPAVSRRHAKLSRRADGGYTISDLVSANGTQLNGKDLEPGIAVPLDLGDVVTLGRWTRIMLTDNGE